MQSSYVCELVHCVREPQLHDALRRRARPSRDDAQLDDDDERRRDDERRLSDDAPAPDASAISSSEILPFLVIKRPNHTTRRLSKIKNPFSWPFINSSSDCHKQSRGPSGGMCENQREFRCAFATSYRTSSSR